MAATTTVFIDGGQQRVCDHVILPAQFFNFLDLLPTPHSEMGVLLLRFMEFVGRVHNLLKTLQILL